MDKLIYHLRCILSFVMPTWIIDLVEITTLCFLFQDTDDYKKFTKVKLQI